VALELAVPVIETVATVTTVQPGVYPNPVVSGQNATLQINSDRGGTATVQVVGTMGNTVQSEQLNLVPGANTKTIHTAGLKPGLYILHVSGNVSKTTALKLMVN